MNTEGDIVMENEGGNGHLAVEPNDQTNLILNAINAIEARTNGRLNNIENVVNTYEGRFNNIDERFNNIEQAVNTAFTGLSQSVDVQKRYVEFRFAKCRQDFPSCGSPDYNCISEQFNFDMKPGRVVALYYNADNSSGGANYITVKTCGEPWSLKPVITGNVVGLFAETVLVGQICAISFLKKKMKYSAKLQEERYQFHIAPMSFEKIGPSVGLASLVAFVSFMTGVYVSPKVAFTGEIDPYGNVTKVSGVQAKLHAAIANGLETVYIPTTSMIDLFGTSFPLNISMEELLCAPRRATGSRGSILVKPVSNFLAVYNDLFKPQLGNEF